MTEIVSHRGHRGHREGNAMIALNLGCGLKRKAGYVNVDLYAPGADRRDDLSKFPWDWPDESVDMVYMSHVLEHFTDVEQVVREVHRILKPGGTWEVLVPHAGGRAAYLPSHKHRFTLGYMADIGCNDALLYAQRRLFRTAEMRLDYTPGLHLGRWSYMLFPVLQRLANLNGSVQALWEFMGWPVDAIYWRGVKKNI